MESIFNSNHGPKIEFKDRAKNKLINAIRAAQPCTSRRLTDITGIERCSVTAHLNALEFQYAAIKKAYYGVCETTGSKASYYALMNWEGKN
jgi:hypothetical protein